MIQANELRIGNWVSATEDYSNYPAPLQVLGLGQYTYSVIGRPETDDFGVYTEVGCNEYFPIPLTPEVLRDCGFECKNVGAGFIAHEYRISINSRGDSFYLRPYYEGGFIWGFNDGIEIGSPAPIEHLHQLQNFYQIHTQTELTYKPS